MIVGFWCGNTVELCRIHGKLDDHVSTGRESEEYKQHSRRPVLV